jgi:hypothetical protein
VRRKADEALDGLRARLVGRAGELDQATRRAAVGGGPVPDVVTALVEKIREHAYKVTDGDIQAVLEAGWTEGQVFELAVATAVGAGLVRREAIDRLLGAS